MIESNKAQLRRHNLEWAFELASELASVESAVQCIVGVHMDGEREVLDVAAIPSAAADLRLLDLLGQACTNIRRRLAMRRRLDRQQGRG